jgi:hypothetical protein
MVLEYLLHNLDKNIYKTNVFICSRRLLILATQPDLF